MGDDTWVAKPMGTTPLLVVRNFPGGVLVLAFPAMPAILCAFVDEATCVDPPSTAVITFPNFRI